MQSFRRVIPKPVCSLVKYLKQTGQVAKWIEAVNREDEFALAVLRFTCEDDINKLSTPLPSGTDTEVAEAEAPQTESIVLDQGTAASIPQKVIVLDKSTVMTPIETLDAEAQTVTAPASPPGGHPPKSPEQSGDDTQTIELDDPANAQNGLPSFEVPTNPNETTPQPSSCQEKVQSDEEKKTEEKVLDAQNAEDDPDHGDSDNLVIDSEASSHGSTRSEKDSAAPPTKTELWEEEKKIIKAKQEESKTLMPPPIQPPVKKSVNRNHPRKDNGDANMPVATSTPKNVKKVGEPPKKRLSDPKVQTPSKQSGSPSFDLKLPPKSAVLSEGIKKKLGLSRNRDSFRQGEMSMSPPVGSKKRKWDVEAAAEPTKTKKQKVGGKREDKVSDELVKVTTYTCIYCEDFSSKKEGKVVVHMRHCPDRPTKKVK